MIEEKKFLTYCEQELSNLAAKVEENDHNAALEVDYADGILNIEIEETEQTYVINRNTASRKIWYSSPTSGADYFSYNESNGKWLNDKNEELDEKLFAELKNLKIFQ